jgi:flagellin
VAITIGSNVSSLTAQRALSNNSSGVSRTFERLSSGLRINRASDDAAGLAVSDRLRADARLYGAAARNINDGFSLINIVSGTLEQQTGILTRLVELAEQSSNGTYSETQRKVLDVEYQQLLREFGRLGDSATFNGLKLLHGMRVSGIGEMHIQAGITGATESRVTITSGDTATLSGIVNRDSIRSVDLNGGGLDISDLFQLLSEDSAGHSDEGLRSKYREQVYFTEFTDSSGTVYEVATAFINGSFFDQTDRVGAQVFSRVRGATHWNASSAAGNVFSFQNGTFDIDPSTGQIIGDGILAAAVGTSTMTIDFSGLRFLSLSPSAGNGSSIDFSGVDSVSRARAALGVINSRMSELSQITGSYGAFESRLQSALALAMSSRETSLQARSRIVDADIGSESAELARRSILQQASAAY